MSVIDTNTIKRALEVLGLCLAAAMFLSCSRPAAESSKPWNPKAAAAYLDTREIWWMQWTQATRDRGTFCVSCHTVLPFALARPALRKVLGEEALTVNELRLLENVRSRVRLGKQIGPYYTDQSDGDRKSAEALGTESILNALILASFDAQTGSLSDDTRLAFETMWALQQKSGNAKGSWNWLRFDLEPWEANDSAYYGATLAAVAVGSAPENYRSSPEIQSNLSLLREYLNREYAAQSLINRVGLLWASAKLPGLIDQERKESIIKEVLSRQREDGGWSLALLSGTWTDGSFISFLRRCERLVGAALTVKSDGYATGLITFSLLRAGIPRQNPQLQRAVSWLECNQEHTDGRWPPYALNRAPKPESIIGRFRSDAASAYAVLALIDTDHQGGQASVVQSRFRAH